jgi:Glucosamine 6-phosphate synthetase, contains amidotransferase and phosphosugar isomerase domains
MCGIVGYVGRAHATPILLDGLRRLEYRGYDSAGIAVVDAGQLDTRKCAGRIAALEKLVKKQPVSGSLGISHTRWATHGKVNDENAHPHFDASGKLALVHNGVIENYQALKDELDPSGDTNFAPTLTRSSRASDRQATTIRAPARLTHPERKPGCLRLFAQRSGK